MAVKKISISLEPEVLERARRAAKAEGVTLSTWLCQAAEEAAGLVEARAALEEYIQVYGPPDEAAARIAALARLRGALPVEVQRRAG